MKHFALVALASAALAACAAGCAAEAARPAAPQPPAAAAPPCTIVVPQGASYAEALAAKEVRRYVYLRTGRLLPIVEGLKTLPEGGDLIVVATENRRLLSDIDHASRFRREKVLPQQYLLETIRQGNRRVLLVAGADEAPTAPLAPGAERTVDLRIPIKDCRLWSPEDPFLYELETRTGADALRTRFGVRSFRFDPETKRALLNGRPYMLRGTNVCIYRFFEDPVRGTKWGYAICELMVFRE